MALDYKCPADVVEHAVRRMIDSQRVSDTASFNFSSLAERRSEIAYRDMDFLETLGYCDEVRVVDEALAFLKANGLVDKPNANYDKKAFLDLRMEVKKNFKGPWGTITPVMERLLYMLSSVRQPRNMLAVGIFWGNAFVWNIGSSCGHGKVYDAERVTGIDLDAEAVAMAQTNINTIRDNSHIRLLAEEGVKFASSTPLRYDYVYLDVGISQIEKSLNFPILSALYDKLEPDAWVLTHDTTHPYFTGSFKKYLSYARDKTRFKESVCFDVDQYGLELSIK